MFETDSTSAANGSRPKALDPTPGDFLGLESELERSTTTSNSVADTVAAPSQSWLLQLDDADAEKIADLFSATSHRPRPKRFSTVEWKDTRANAKSQIGRVLLIGLGVLATGAAIATGWRVWSAHGEARSEPVAQVLAPLARPRQIETELSLPGNAPSAPVLLNTAAHAIERRPTAPSSPKASVAPPRAIEHVPAPLPPIPVTTVLHAQIQPRIERALFEASSTDESDEIGTSPGDEFPRSVGGLLVRSHARRAVAVPGSTVDESNTALESSVVFDPFADPTSADHSKPSPPAHTGVRRATAEDMLGMWEGTSIPTSAISASAKLLTPFVGRVRAVLPAGQVFDGSLHAVGEGQIWIDTELGRIALVAGQVQKLLQLGAEAGSGKHDVAAESAGLPRTRVRTQGGVFYGKVLAREGLHVTLLTDEGARIVLDALQIEAAPVGGVVVLRSKPEPPPKPQADPH